MEIALTLEQRIKMQIGELIIQNHALAAELEAAKAKIEAMEKSNPPASNQP